MKKSGNTICINNGLEKPVELWHLEMLPNGEEKRTKIGLVTNITAYYHILAQAKQKKLTGYYFKEPSGITKVDILPNGKVSDTPDWLFSQFDKYIDMVIF